MRSLPRLGLLGSLCAAVMVTPAQADGVADFYNGKTVSLIAGFPPGGGYDTYVRVLSRHYGRFIPGQPAIVASNMPGAGSLTAANNIYSKAAADGTALAMFAASAAMEPLLGNKAALFDATKFSWIGSMSQDVAYCGVWQTPGAATSFDEMMTKETIFGGGGTAAITFQHPMVMKNILGANIRVIAGYPGTREINLAMHRGEVNGTCGMFASSVKAQFMDDVKSGRLKLVISDGQQEIRRIREYSERIRLREDRRGPGGAGRAFQAAPARTSVGRATGNSGGPAEGTARRAGRHHEGPGIPRRGQPDRTRH